MEGRRAAVPRVLIVEDDDALRAIISLLLRDEGHDVLEFADGRQALDWLNERDLASEGPWVVVLDLMMPVMNGEEFLKELEARSLMQSVGVVVMTTNSYWKAEGIITLRKPFVSGELVDRVVELSRKLGETRPS
jgi:DNA-binding response OmpR family regulator